MLKIDLFPLFKARGIKRPYAFLRELGLGHTVAYRFTNEEVKSIRLDHAYRICLALGCTPNDLIRLDDATSVHSDHPLMQLKRPALNIDLLEEVKGVPLDKLNKLKEAIDQIKESSYSSTKPE